MPQNVWAIEHRPCKKLSRFLEIYETEKFLPNPAVRANVVPTGTPKF
jgi:hypothetical protein